MTELGGLHPTKPLSAGECYSVVSDVPTADPKRLRTADGDHPDAVRTRYLELPESTTDRLRRRAREITTDAETDYDRAAQVRRWLERRKGYSLDIERPEGDIADAFVFEMDVGYCVYFATAMVRYCARSTSQRGSSSAIRPDSRSRTTAGSPRDPCGSAT